MRLPPKRPCDWPNEYLETSFWRYFECETIARVVAIFCLAAFAWILVSEGYSSSLDSPYSHGCIFISMLASLYAQQVRTVREFLTRYRAELAEAPLDEFIPPQSRLDKVVVKAYVLIARLVVVAVVGYIIYRWLIAPFV